MRRLIEALDESGRLADTLVIFMSDNGFLLGEHGMLGKNTYWAEAVNIPAYIAGPGVARGGEIAELTSTVDIAPTIAAAAGVEPTHPVDGLDLRGPIPTDRAILIEGSRQGDATDNWVALETRRWVYLDRPSGRHRLFDKVSDPGQLNDLAASPDMRRSLRRFGGPFTPDVDAPAAIASSPSTARRSTRSSQGRRPRSPLHRRRSPR